MQLKHSADRPPSGLLLTDYVSGFAMLFLCPVMYKLTVMLLLNLPVVYAICWNPMVISLTRSLFAPVHFCMILPDFRGITRKQAVNFSYS